MGINFLDSQSYYADHYDNPYSQETGKGLERLTKNFLKSFTKEENSEIENEEASNLETTESTISEVEIQPLGVLLKPRNWPKNEQGNKMKNLMEPFLNEHLSKIQKVALKSSSTVHFGRKPPYRTPGLEKFAHIESPLSFRVTRTGDVWLLFKNKISEDHNVRYCYSPTLGIYGAKKGINFEKKEIYEFLSKLNHQIKISNKESPIIPVLDIVSVPLRKFMNPDTDTDMDPKFTFDPTAGESDKYSIITPKFNFSLNELENKNFTCHRDIQNFLYCLKESIFLWANLIDEQRIIHPDFNSGNVVFSLNENNLISEVKLIDFDEFTAPLPTFVFCDKGIQYLTRNITLIYLDSSISFTLKNGLDAIYNLTKNCVDKILILSEKKKFTPQYQEYLKLIEIAKELISGLNVLAFGPLFLDFENDSNWLLNKDKYLEDCIEQIVVIEHQVSIHDIIERSYSFIKKIEKLIT